MTNRCTRNPRIPTTTHDISNQLLCLAKPSRLDVLPELAQRHADEVLLTWQQCAQPQVVGQCWLQHSTCARSTWLSRCPWAKHRPPSRTSASATAHPMDWCSSAGFPTALHRSRWLESRRARCRAAPPRRLPLAATPTTAQERQVHRTSYLTAPHACTHPNRGGVAVYAGQ